MKKLIITGASGYIGSCLVQFLKKKYKISSIDKVYSASSHIIKCNMLNLNRLCKILKKEKPDVVIHLAGQSLVDENINKKKYYLNNVVATKNLIIAMKMNKIENLIFSSTAAIYKYKNTILSENDDTNPISTYAKTKFRCEKLIKNSNINSIILRFFNVCSALKINNKVIGELHNPETHLIPTIVYKNIKRKKIYIYGNDFKTKDGTCLRDYVHIKDICSSIKSSINYLLKTTNRYEILNIGSNKTFTNFEILNNISKITKVKNNYKIIKRRKGDVDKLHCSNRKAKNLIKWKPMYSNINNILKDEITWVKKLLIKKKFRRFKNYL
tara:strand:+ start:322 stop:1299 length:978 start_codon:yes stop_codon:yes gene_type:complete